MLSGVASVDPPPWPGTVFVEGFRMQHVRFILGLLGAAWLWSATAAATPPNVVFIIADDLGHMDTSPYNPDSFYDTPSIKPLADSGTRFTNGYAACPVCSPTRSAVMTGQ